MLAVVVTILHAGGSGYMVVFHRTEAALGFGSHLSDGAALFRTALLPPRLGKGLEKVSQTLPASPYPGQLAAAGGDPSSAVRRKQENLQR